MTLGFEGVDGLRRRPCALRAAARRACSSARRRGPSCRAPRRARLRARRGRRRRRSRSSSSASSVARSLTVAAMHDASLADRFARPSSSRRSCGSSKPAAIAHRAACREPGAGRGHARMRVRPDRRAEYAAEQAASGRQLRRPRPSARPSRCGGGLIDQRLEARPHP